MAQESSFIADLPTRDSSLQLSFCLHQQNSKIEVIWQ
jgi:hypothetical protein